MNAVKVKSDIYWVGAIDWAVRDFHGYVTPQGTTYNNYLIIDDEINTGGSLIETVNALISEGAREVYSCATHGVLSGAALQRIEASPLKEVIVTDTIPLPEGTDSDRITVLSVAPLFGEAIRRIHRGESVGALFSSEVELVEEMTFWGAHGDDEEEAEAVTVEG